MSGSFVDDVAALAETARRLAERARAIREMRARDGRALSEGSRKRLAELVSELERVAGALHELTFADEETAALEAELGRLREQL